ncbi:hypothetical protein [Winogradskyella sp.]|uniref:hypothetical protein n=1 Tax=Winogradskyella sp. TaxID=1883156 RepID=UPI00261BCAF3|nr:hypothetical protein [Winogradskyella sp.]
MLSYTVQELYLFLNNPKKIEPNKKIKFKNLFIQFLIFDFCACVAYGLLNSILFQISDDYKQVFNNRNIVTNPFVSRWAIVILIAPILEELAYRLGLKINRRNVSISIGIQLIIFLTILGVISLPLHFKILLMVMASVTSYMILNEKMLLFFAQNKNTFVYYNIICFGLLHAFNFNYFLS